MLDVLLEAFSKWGGGGGEGAYRAPLGKIFGVILPSPMPFKPLILFKGKLRTGPERMAETNYVKLCTM